MNIEDKKICTETEEKKTNKIVLIDFFADWCGPCKMQDPIIEELKKKFDGKVEFKKVDVDEDSKLADKYNIHAIPTLIVEKDGNLFARYVGVTNLNVLATKINEALEAR